MLALEDLGLERSSLSDDVRTDRFNALLRSGDFNLALAQADEAIASLIADFPDRPPPAVWVYHQSLVLSYLGRYSEALTGFEWVSRLAASQDRLSQERAELDAAAALSKLGRREEAERHYRSATDIAKTGLQGQVPSSDLAALLTRAKLDIDAGQFDLARMSLRLVMSSKAPAPSLATAHRLRALANLSTGDLPGALSDARTAVELAGQQRGDKPFSAWVGEAKLVLGRVLEAQGDLPDARAAYTDAVQQLTHSVVADHPSLQLARHNLAELSKAAPRS
jgi:tetratricopeptide (TPR) repeat protein